MLDATDGLEDFAGDPDSATPTDEEPPELVWLDASDGLDEFAPALSRSPLVTAAPPTHAAEGQSSSMTDVPIPQPDVFPGWTGEDVTFSDPSRFDWMKRASRAALLCAAVVAVADGILFRYAPAPPQTSGQPAEPPIGAPEPADRVEAAVLPPFVPDPPAVVSAAMRTGRSGPPRVVEPSNRRGAPSASARSEGRPPTPGPRRLGTIDPPAGRETPAANMAAVAGSRRVADPAVATATLVPDAALSAAVAPPAVALAAVVADPSAAAPTGETSRSGSPDPSRDTVAGPPRRELETRAIENVLGRYRNAFNRLDADAALAVWPTANEKNLTRAFDSLEDQDVSFDSCRIELLAGLAEAACSGTSRYVPKVGSRTPKAEARRWNFSLRKATGEWLIDRVDAR